MSYLEGVSLWQLESFVAIAEAGSVGRAAKRLHTSQPPLSRQLRNLEEELGVALVERHARGVRLLPAGERLLPYARQVLAAVDTARRVVKETVLEVSAAGIARAKRE